MFHLYALELLLHTELFHHFFESGACFLEERLQELTFLEISVFLLQHVQDVLDVHFIVVAQILLTKASQNNPRIEK